MQNIVVSFSLLLKVIVIPVEWEQISHVSTTLIILLLRTISPSGFIVSTWQWFLPRTYCKVTTCLLIRTKHHTKRILCIWMSAFQTKLSSGNSKWTIKSTYGNKAEKIRGLGTRRIAQAANVLLTKNTGHDFTTEGSCWKGK